VSRIGRGGPDRLQCADAAKRSRFDRVGIVLAASASSRRRPSGKARQRRLSIYMLSVCLTDHRQHDNSGDAARSYRWLCHGQSANYSLSLFGGLFGQRFIKAG
jgi:hypothetical protein